MPKADIGPKIGIDGEAEFKKQINEINTSLKTLGTEMKTVTSEFQNNANSSKSLTEQNKVLQKQVGELNDKLKVQNQALEEARKKYGDDSAEVQRWQQEVNKTQTALNNANAQIERNNDLLSEKRIAVMKGIAEGFAVMATAAVTAATAIGKLTLDSAAWADDLNTLSKQTGISTEDLQKYQYAADRIDVSMETLTGSMSKLTKNMSSARNGSGAAAEAFEQLGINVVDSSGQLRDNEDVFKETIKALGNIENETERDAAAMAIFGKSAQELNPLILGGADALEELGAQAEAAGLILEQGSLDKLNELSDATDGLKATAEAAGHAFSVQFASPMAAAVNLATGYVEQLVGSFDGGFSAMGETVGKILTDITSQINNYLPDVINLGMEIIMSLVEGITQMLPDILQTCITIITTMVESLTEHLPELIPVAVEAIITLVDTLISNIDQLIDASITLIMALADGLIDALPILIEKAPVLVSHLVSAIIENAPKLLTSALELITKLATGLLSNMSKIWDAAVDIVKTVIDGIKSMAENIYNIGVDVVRGIIEGITSSFDWAWKTIKSWFGNVLQKVKDFLGISSPSKAFAEIGGFMAEGIGVGWGNEIGAVSRNISNSLGSLLPDSTANIGVVSAMSGSGMRSAMAASVNALGAMQSANTGKGNLNITIQANGREFYRATLGDFRLINSQNPIILNDF